MRYTLHEASPLCIVVDGKSEFKRDTDTVWSGFLLLDVDELLAAASAGNRRYAMSIHTHYDMHTHTTEIPARCNATGFFILKAYPLQDVAAKMSLRNRCPSSATLLYVGIAPNICVLSFSHICIGFYLLLFPTNIPCI